MMELKYRLFDGEKIRNGALVKVENGFITEVSACDISECGDGFLIPGLMDAHTHMGTSLQVQSMLKAGITATCDVSASSGLVKAAKPFTIIPSTGMAMGMVMNPKGYVERAAESGAKYIKVLLFNSLSIGKIALRGIVKAAHERNLRVAVHATEISTYHQAVDAGADILLHIPMKEEFPIDLAKTISDKGIVVVPTLVMMETFAHSGRSGYLPEHYSNAEKAVRLLYESGVKILAGTDANPGSFAPSVEYGRTLHYELQLLQKAGLPKLDILKAATSNIANAFGLDMGCVTVGSPANLLLCNEEDLSEIKQLWIGGKPLK